MIKLPKSKLMNLDRILISKFNGPQTKKLKKAAQFLNDLREDVNWFEERNSWWNKIPIKLRNSLTGHEADFLVDHVVCWGNEHMKQAEKKFEASIDTRHILSSSKINSFILDKYGLNGKTAWTTFFQRMTESELGSDDFFLLPADEKDWEETALNKSLLQKGRDGALYFLVVLKEFGEFVSEWDGERFLAVRNDLKATKKKPVKKRAKRK